MRKIMLGWRALLISLCVAGCTTFADAGNMSPNVVAIGDLHGDFEAYLQLLQEAELVNARGQWTGGDSVLVQTGDVPDRGPNSLKIINHLRELQNQARRKGGRVVTLIGNHEAMNITGDLRYVHPEEYAAFVTRKSRSTRNRFYETNKRAIETAILERDPALSSDAVRSEWEAQTPLGMIEHQMAWRPGGDIGDWVVENPAVAIIDDTLFVHGGISEKYTAYSVSEINSMITEALQKRESNSMSIINDEFGPLWYRGLVRRDEPTSDAASADAETLAARSALSMESEIDLVLETYGVKRIVVGHTPSLSGITVRYGNRLIQIDTGISKHYGGTQSFLQIRNGKIYANDNGVESVIGDQE